MEQDCKEIEQKAIQVFTSCTRYNRNMATAIRDRPVELAGAAMTCLIEVQGTEQTNKKSQTYLVRQPGNTISKDSGCVGTTSVWMA
eukprot:7368441-Ditylum_brightwellii.AAC.1